MVFTRAGTKTQTHKPLMAPQFTETHEMWGGSDRKESRLAWNLGSVSVTGTDKDL